MDDKGMETLDPAPFVTSIGPQLTEEEARRIFTLGFDAVVFVVMELARRLGESNLPLQRPCHAIG